MKHPPFDFAGLRATVMGLGRFGGGVGVVRFLLNQGAFVTVSDRGSFDDHPDVVHQFPASERLSCHLGGHQHADFADADLLVVSPAVPPGNHFVRLARESGATVTSEIGLFWQRCRGRILGVTGTNGKSTTATLLHDCLKYDGRNVWLGGNIGGSLLSDIDEISADDWVVLELSSFQLTALDEMQVSPHIAVVTNFSANHLDWHADLDEYRQAKQTILRWQRPGDIAVLGGWDEVRDWPVQGKRRIAGQTDGSPEVPDSLCGPHHARNLAAVVATARELGVRESAIQQAIRDYKGLPHRMQLVGELRGRRVYNDSAATTPESTLAALTSLDGPKVVLVGGADKGIDLTQLADELFRHAEVVVLMGDVAPKLKQLMQTVGSGRSRGPRDVVTAHSFEDAIEQAFSLSSAGDAILLSPGCSSHGWFTNFVDRGERFVRLIHEVSG